MSAPSRPPHRRPGLLGVGLLLLALWVQALAPVAALRTSLAAADPLAGAVICGHAAGGTEAGASVDEPVQAAPACGLCRLCCAGIAPPLPSARLAVRSLRWIARAWPVPPVGRPGPTARYAGQPRAPPAHA